MRPGLAVLSIVTLALASQAAALELADMGQEEIRQLQLRLQDAGCYSGAIDGIGGPGTQKAIDDCPVMEPRLRIETGMHTASIGRVGASLDGQLVVTGSDDKTARVWSMPEGELVTTLRVPISDGNEGKIYAAAISPDGGIVATGGWDAKSKTKRSHYVYLLDTATGKTVRRLGPLPNVALDLAFSLDGARVAAGLGRKNGVRVWNAASGELVLEDKDYGNQVYGVTFDGFGRMATTSYDGHVRLYSADGALLKKTPVEAGERPFAAAFLPDGSRLAVGFVDKPVVEVYDGDSLVKLYSPDTSDTNSNLTAVAWSADGSYLYAGGKHDVSGENQILRWARGGEGARLALPGPRNTIMDLVPDVNGGVVWTSADPAFGLIGITGDAALTRKSKTGDLRAKRGDDFTISRDGRIVRFGLGFGGDDPLVFDVGELTLAEAPDPIPNLAEPDIDSLDVSGWKNGLTPTLGDRELELEQYERSRALAIMPAGTATRGFFLGTDWRIRRFDTAGDLVWDKQVPGTTGGVIVSGDGRLLVAAYGDGTVRWHRVSDGQELLALFVHRDRRWVAWTPSGYYASSPGGEELIGWHMNRGWDQKPDFFPTSRFRDQFYRPDVVSLVTEILNETGALAEADRIAGRRHAEANILQALPPVVEIISPASGVNVTSQEVTVTYLIRSPSGAAVTDVDVLINGRPTRGLTRLDTEVSELMTATVTIPPADARIGLVARTADSVSEVTEVAVKWTGSRQTDFAKPALYALLIGVSDYDDENLRLGFAAKDASDMELALKAQEGGLYRDVSARVLTDPSKDDVLEGFDWLAREVTSKDMAVIFIAGHGITNPQQRFYFLPREGNPESLRRTAIPEDEITDLVSSLPGKVLLFLDACHSGETLATTSRRRGPADITRVVNELSSAENGAVMFASSTGREVSVEDARWQNGAFTEAILEGLAGGADYTGDRAITVKELDTFIANKVKELTGGLQHPVTQMPNTIPDFPIAAVL